MLEDCNKLAKCKRYVGDYSHNGQQVTIKYDGVHFIMDKQGKATTCTCTDEGTLTIKAATVNAMLTLKQDSDGKKTVCIETTGDSTDCMQNK